MKTNVLSETQLGSVPLPPLPEPIHPCSPPPPKNPQKKEKPHHWIKLHYFVLNNKTSQTVLSNQIEVSY